MVLPPSAAQNLTPPAFALRDIFGAQSNTSSEPICEPGAVAGPASSWPTPRRRPSRLQLEPWSFDEVRSFEPIRRHAIERRATGRIRFRIALRLQHNLSRLDLIEVDGAIQLPTDHNGSCRRRSLAPVQEGHEILTVVVSASDTLDGVQNDEGFSPSPFAPDRLTDRASSYSSPPVRRTSEATNRAAISSIASAMALAEWPSTMRNTRDLNVRS